MRFVSVRKDIVKISDKKRTKEQKNIASKTKPRQLIELMDMYINENRDRLEFDRYSDDEFWIVFDIDNNLQDRNEFGMILEECDKKNYCHAISNPFFELWLLLHYSTPNSKDEEWAVTEGHPYQTTKHFRNRLRELGHPLKKGKYIRAENMTEKFVRNAISNGGKLWEQNKELFPYGLYTEMFLLVGQIISIADEEDKIHIEKNCFKLN